MKVLIVEDEIGIANFLRQGLEEESYEVEVANDGQIGLDLALKSNFDILLLDWMLPNFTGLEICQAFRKTNTDTPIIFLTAKDTLDDTIAALKSGANDYIKKPFHFEELLERIKVQLRDKVQSTSALQLGPIRLDAVSHRVFKHEEEIYLTQKEFALLQYLMEHKGSVCTRTHIIEQVWDIHFEYNSGVIDVYINALRKKLSLGEDENYIQTIRGIGYLAKEL
jgi:two-component system, OmpR family, copper resistance phosphate regulon response regulator CusR